MKFVFVNIILLFLLTNVIGQKNFLELVDTNFISNQYLSDSTDPIELFNDARLNEELDPLNPDIELLNAGLYAGIQYERKRKACETLAHSIHQYTLCNKFLEFYFLKRFNGEAENLEKFEKTAGKALKKIRFPKGITKVVTFKTRMLNYKNDNYYYWKGDQDSELKLFKGMKPKGLDSTEMAELKKEPLKTFTYKEYIQTIIKEKLKKKYKSILFSKKFSSMACYFKVDERTVKGRRIPEAALIIIFGANRLKNMDEAVKKSKRQRRLI